MDIQALPEGCISHVISLTGPRDACRSAAVSTTFRSAVASDAIWERFLPSDYHDILARAVDHVEYNTKRELYFRLCDQPLLIDGGRMSFSLEKSTGAKCYMLSAPELCITWGDTSMYWRWIHLPDSRFSEVAELLGVCWLEIRGKIGSKLLSRKTTYEAFLIYKIAEHSYGLDLPFQEATVEVGDQLSKNMVQLEEPTRRSRHFMAWHTELMNPNDGEMDVDIITHQTPRRRDDGWMEIVLGEFHNDEGEDGEVEISLMEIKGGNWKRGLLIQGIEMRPKKEN